MGYLVPILLKECLPGDTWQIEAGLMLRFAPMPGAVMHRFNVFFHYFFVPNRIIWDEWEDFITGSHQGDGIDTNPIPPTITLQDNTAVNGTLPDYFGLPITAKNWTGSMTPQMIVSALPFRAYDLIYNEWYRDEWLQNEIAISKDSGNDSTTDINLLQRNWEKDYFTSCLPDVQKGAPVSIGMTGTADVTIDNAGNQLDIGVFDNGATFYQGFADLNTPEGFLSVDRTKTYDNNNQLRPKGQGISNESLTGTADLTSATAININALRLAFQLQKWEERNARAGSRYRESLMAHFGVISPDFRLQRPEFIGGVKCPVSLNEVVQTSSAVTASPQGNMSGHGIAIGGISTMKYSTVEHGFVVGLMSIMPRTAYQQGLEKMWQRKTKFDYFWPEFAHIGEQPVLRNEIYALGGADQSTTDILPFGYRGYGDEYRMSFSQVCGDFRDTMDYWHDGRIFDDSLPPYLNSQFIKCTPDKRIFSDENPSDFSCWLHLLHSIKALRPMPLVADPGLIDHN
nr:MAG: major capsid protein [Microviridae sp.]